MQNNISIVVAIAQNNAIGVKNQLLAHVPGDLPRFKALTTNHTVVMGRKTFESLPKGALPNRRNIVLSANKDLALANCEIAHSPEEVLELIKPNEKLFIIGGSEIYRLFISLANKLYITVIEKTYPEADAFFPSIDYTRFALKSEEVMPVSEKNDFSYRYQVWERNESNSPS